MGEGERGGGQVRVCADAELGAPFLRVGRLVGWMMLRRKGEGEGEGDGLWR